MLTDRYIFREARLQDVPVIGRILDDAVARMLAEGKKQWNENYPNEIHVLADLSRHVGFVLELNGRVVAYGAVVFTGEPAYDNLRGEWLTDDEYVVLHRMAVAADSQCRGVARRFFAAVENLAVSKGICSFRVDTNYDNGRMLRLLGSLGFEYCGKVNYESGERMAFEKRL